MTTGCTAIIIDITDERGEPIGRSVPVAVVYQVTLESAYGADADGNRGELRKEIDILDHYIAPGDLMTLDSGQVEQLIGDADRQALKALCAN